MDRSAQIFVAFAILFVASVYSQQFKIVLPTYRPPPPPKYPVIRIAREAGNEPTKPDTEGMYELHTELPSIFKDKESYLSRHARSLRTPGRGRQSGSSSGRSKDHDTGPTHPGHNRRNAREAGNEPSGINRYDMFKIPTERSIIYDDIRIGPSRRYARSLSTPGRGRPSGSSSRGSRGHDTGPTHPGYNRRNAREAGNKPFSINKSDMIKLPTERSIIYDDIKLDPSSRYARSLSTPGRGRATSNSRSNRGHDTGLTHAGYNRRNTRESGKPDNVLLPSNTLNNKPSTVSTRDASVSHAGNKDMHRFARSLHIPTPLPPFNPKPRWPPSNKKSPRFPIYA